MTTTADRTDEATLPDAIRELADAVDDLIAPMRDWMDGQYRTAPSRHEQLLASVGGGSGARSGRVHSSTPVWCDALDLVNLIDTTTAEWEPADVAVQARYERIVERKWRPQDTAIVTVIAETTTGFVDRIDELLVPEPVVYLNDPNNSQPAACTNCGTRRVHKPDPASPGKTIMQPALKITAGGCVCQRCRTRWEPGQLRMLAAALGYPLPTGVLE